MKILYIANIRLPTEKAHGLQIMKTCEAFARLGHMVELVVSDRRTSIIEDPFVYYGVERTFAITRLSTPGTVRFGHLGFLLETISFSISALMYALLHSTDIIFSRDEIVLWPISFFKKEIVWESHDGRLNRAAKRMLRVAKKIVVTTAHTRAAYIAMGALPEKVLLARNGVDLDAFECAPEAVAELRKKLAPNGVHIIMYAGRLDGWKGVDTLLETSKLLPHSARLVVVGGEPKQVVRLKSAYPNVSFVGFVPYREVGCYQQAADMLVLPNTGKDIISINNTSPLKLFTYMAAGKPIIASDLPSIREVLDDESCFFVSPDDPMALLCGIEEVLKNSELAMVRARRARELVQNYTWVARAKHVLGALDDQLTSLKDQGFYDAASGTYSMRRYPEHSVTFTQFFFKSRLKRTLALLEPYLIASQTPVSTLLEIGCADGVVARAIWERFLPSLSRLDAVDIAPKMIRAAEQQHADTDIHFLLRTDKELPGVYDIVVEIGVLNFSDTATEFESVAAALNPDGRYVCSLAGSSSLQYRFKGGSGYRHLRSYSEYEKELEQYFDIIRVDAIGLFIPLLWRIPFVARIIQPIIETVARPLVPDFFHEKVYVLRQKKRL